MLGKLRIVSVSANVTNNDVTMVPYNPQFFWSQMPNAKIVTANPNVTV